MGLIVIWVGLVAWSLFRASQEARAGLEILESVRDDLALEDLETGTIQAALTEASANFKASQDHVRAPWVTPLRLVPLAGVQVRSADALSSSAARAVDVLRDGADELVEIKDRTEAGSIGRVAAARQSSVVAGDTAAALDALELGPATGLVPPLHNARAEFREELADILDLAKRGEIAAEGIADFLAGPSQYLLLSANTAEMRAGTGMFLMAGVVDIEDGEIEVGELQQTGDLRLERAVPITDGDLEANWGWMQPDKEWRNLAASPRLAASAEMAAAMWQEQTSTSVDGVLVVDPVALESLLQASGPVEVDGSVISAENIVSIIAFDQYWEEDAEIRRDRLRSIAAGSFEAISDPDVDLFTLASGLADAVAGRHMMAWSAKPSHQAAWEALEADGALSPESVMISVLNRGANKLDTFLDVSSTATSNRVDNTVVVDMAITLTNRTGPGLPEYVLGPSQALGVERGTYVGILTVNVPGSARDLRFRDVDSLVVNGSDGPTSVQGIWVELPAGESVTHNFEFTLNAGQARMVIEPSARIPTIDWMFDGTGWADSGPRTLDLDAADYGSDPSVNIFRAGGDIRSSQTAIAPTPRVALNRADKTSVAVSWRVVLDNVAVVVWEKTADQEWAAVYEGMADDATIRSGLEPATEVCYRTALATTPRSFSSPVCVFIPEPEPPVGYLEFSGDPESYLLTPDFVTGSVLDIRALVAPDEWNPPQWQMFVGQFDQLNNDRSWRFGIDSFNSFRANFSADGLEPLGDAMELPDFFVDGIPEWVRLTIDTEAGLERFWISDDGQAWNQWGRDLVFDPLELHDAAGPVFLGTDRLASDNAFDGRIYYLEIRTGPNSETVALLDLRTNEQRTGEDTWTDATGRSWVAQGSGWSYVDPVPDS